MTFQLCENDIPYDSDIESESEIDSYSLVSHNLISLYEQSMRLDRSIYSKTCALTQTVFMNHHIGDWFSAIKCNGGR